ncbi:MAG: MATE family efflux transporter [Coriobacteriia bacterium]|nr:MATE family efflux transporter [Coriobacteriia bacterium]
MSKSNTIDMLNGPLALKLVQFAIPIAIAGVLQQLFNSADAAVAGRFVGPEALAAIGGTTPVVMLLISLFTGLSVGTNVLVALRIGQGHPEKIGDAVHTSIAVALVSGFILLVAGIVFVEPLLALISMPEDAFAPAVLYLDIFFLGMPFSMVYNFGSAVLRSKGDTRRPLYALIVAVILNVGLNIAFVTVVPWGIAGVAIATDIANAASAGLIVWFLMHEEGPYRLQWRKLRATKAELLVILKIGVPAGLQGVVFSLSNVVIQSGINSFGTASTAGVAAALNFEFYTYFLINAFTQAAVTFVGQNYAARKFKRCDRVFGLCLAFAMGSVLVLNAVWLMLGANALRIFTTDDAAIEYGLMRMWYGMAFQFIAATYEVTAGTMRGMGWSMTPTVITIVGSCVLRIVWIFTVFAANPDFITLIIIYPISWVVTGVAMFITYYFVRKRAYAKATAGV